MKCNLCDKDIDVSKQSSTLVEHIQAIHKDIYDLHKDNPEATVGFRVEFLHMNVLKSAEVGGDKVEPVIIETTTEDEVETVETTQDNDIVNMQYVMLDTKRKHKTSSSTSEARKRSWIWKYFNQLSKVVYRCNICDVVLSTKGSNSNNLNRHMRTKHPDTFKSEKFGEAVSKDPTLLCITDDVDTPYAIKTEEIREETPSHKTRRSWIWSYFEYVSTTQAQCKLCHRHIHHGGNATGNMNRHLKMIHNKTATEHDMNWIWKVFDNEDEYCTCKICQHRLCKNNPVSDMTAICNHLRKEHGVVSGAQIITSTECEIEEN